VPTLSSWESEEVFLAGGIGVRGDVKKYCDGVIVIRFGELDMKSLPM
jgi:hypothetical protein